jgi:hypothetical protein
MDEIKRAYSCLYRETITLMASVLTGLLKEVLQEEIVEHLKGQSELPAIPISD